MTPNFPNVKQERITTKGRIKTLLNLMPLILSFTAVHPVSVAAQTNSAVMKMDDVDPTKLASATQLLDTILPVENREEMMSAMLRPMMQNIQSSFENNTSLQKVFNDDAEIKKVFQTYMQKLSDKAILKMQLELPTMVTAMSRAYARQFTLQEMADAKVFFSSPSGRAYMSKAGGIMNDPDVTKWMQDYSKSFQSEIESDQAAIFEEIVAIQAKKNGAANKKRRK